MNRRSHVLVLGSAAVVAVLVTAGVLVPRITSTGGDSAGIPPTVSAIPPTTGPAPAATDRFGASPSPSASAKPSPSASAKPKRRSGWPGPDDTGVPAGVNLKPSGSITITKAGTVIDGLDVRGCIEVRANRVTIKRTRVRGSCSSGTISTGDYNKYTGILIEDVEIDGLSQNAGAPTLAYSGFTCRRCDIHGGGHGVQLGRGATVVDSWVHDMFTEGDSHNNAIAAFSTNNLKLVGNRLECLDVKHCTAAIALLEDENGPTHDVYVEDNLVMGGGYCVYAGVSSSGNVNIKFRRNAFSRDPYSTCGEYGPAIHWRPGPGNEWTGNYWNDARRTPIPPPKGD